VQNIITRTKYEIVEEAVKYVKRSFTVLQGYSLFQVDYSQAELRLMAHYSQDKAMLEAYRNNQDLHELTAASARKMTLEEFKNLPPKDYKQFRYEAKAHNFGFIYKISAPGFQDYARIEYGITISRKQAQAVQNAFFELYPKILDYHKLYINKGRKFGYVRTMFGRKVRLPDLESPNGGKRGHAERNTINSPIQGTVGEMTIFAFTLLSYRLNPRVFFINTGHDSIIYYIPDELIEETLPIIRKTMEELPIKLYFDKELTLPMQTDFERSKESWGQLEEYIV
jgi:DNA polymerase-1